MSDLRELYQQVILDHNRSPKNFRAIENGSSRAEGHNPLCGDRVTVYVHLEGDVVDDVSFLGEGCAISKASASLMTQALKGKTRAEVERLFAAFHAMVTSEAEPDAALGKLAVFQGVRDFPMRVKCATLAWHTLEAALRHNDETVTTEAQA